MNSVNKHSIALPHLCARQTTKRTEMQQTETKYITNGWFRETEALWPGQALCLQVKKIIASFRSKFQDILVFDSTNYQRVLVLDGVIQLTERDEAGYQEMIAHVPLLEHPNPKSVLVIGGGDGGVLRELVKHESIEKITLCEIDEKVIEVSKEYFTNTMATAFDNPKVTVVNEDGNKFLDSHPAEFDVIIVDSSDPVGPANTLFQEEFYQKMKMSLKEEGIICTQGENIFLHIKIITDLLKFCQGMFSQTSYYQTQVPTYPNGSIGFIICSNRKDNFGKIHQQRKVAYQHIENDAGFRYYSDIVHSAAFVLPRFAEKEIKKLRS
eukprot:snap_masked-scaffold_27-processed-gene-0.13-mRNA-1 protein AED:0.02 eAED:0.02 QI:0/-1/0/1/-1/1/1/0/323